MNADGSATSRRNTLTRLTGSHQPPADLTRPLQVPLPPTDPHRQPPPRSALGLNAEPPRSRAFQATALDDQLHGLRPLAGVFVAAVPDKKETRSISSQQVLGATLARFLRFQGAHTLPRSVAARPCIRTDSARPWTQTGGPWGGGQKVGQSLEPRLGPGSGPQG